MSECPTCLKLQIVSPFQKCAVYLAARSLAMINFEFHPLLIHEPDRILMACSFERQGVKGGERPEGYMTAPVHRAGSKG